MSTDEDKNQRLLDLIQTSTKFDNALELEVKEFLKVVNFTMDNHPPFIDEYQKKVEDRALEEVLKETGKKDIQELTDEEMEKMFNRGEELVKKDPECRKLNEMKERYYKENEALQEFQTECIKQNPKHFVDIYINKSPDDLMPEMKNKCLSILQQKKNEVTDLIKKLDEPDLIEHLKDVVKDDLVQELNQILNAKKEA